MTGKLKAWNIFWNCTKTGSDPSGYHIAFLSLNMQNEKVNKIEMLFQTSNHFIISVDVYDVKPTVNFANSGILLNIYTTVYTEEKILNASYDVYETLYQNC